MNFIFDKVIKQQNNKILCVGRNYIKHAKEMNAEIPKFPMFFEKPWSSLVWEPNPIRLRQHEGHIIDHEVELGFVIKKEAKSIKKENFKDYIECYFVCLDLTDRTFQARLKNDRHPWFFAKGQDNFLPISKFISNEEIKDPHNLSLNLWVNSEQRQSDNTSSMYFKIPELLSYLTDYITLVPGDLILTGTPSGVGPVKIGDNLKANIIQEGKEIMEMNFKVEKFNL